MPAATKRAKAKPSPAGRRGRGRPKQEADSADVRAALLDAARRLFSERGFHEVSTREIAREAQANPAMIRYYFEDKEGLYKAMLQQVFQRLLAGVGELAAGTRDESPIAEVLNLYARTLFRDPWIPRLLIREVLSDGAPFREEFIEQFARPASKLLPELLEREKAAGRLRDDLDPTLGTLSLMGMTLFPFLAFPVAGRVFGIRLDDDFRERFLDHTLRMFTNGAEKT